MFKVILIFVSAFLTYKVGNLKAIGAVRGSCFVILLMGLMIHFWFDKSLFDELITIIFGASFVGMASKAKFSSFDIFIASIFFFIIFETLYPHAKGLGGGLGTTAFLSCIVAFGIKKVKQLLTTI